MGIFRSCGWGPRLTKNSYNQNLKLLNEQFSGLTSLEKYRNVVLDLFPYGVALLGFTSVEFFSLSSKTIIKQSSKWRITFYLT